MANKSSNEGNRHGLGNAVERDNWTSKKIGRTRDNFVEPEPVY
jgi:hypothetical protein